jgi:drug/metabolite transporter (DMT)-like permease
MHEESSPLHHTHAAQQVICSRSVLSVIVGGQLLALLITGTGVFSQLLTDRNVNIPTSQSFVNYLCLACFMVPRVWRWRKKRSEQRLHHQLSSRGDDRTTEWESHSHSQQHVSHHHQQQQQDSGVRATHHPSIGPIRDSVESGTPEYSSSSSSSQVQDSSLSTGESLLKVEWWKYAFLAACDVEGNFLLVKAYQYTTITSVQLLDCFTIPMVMLFSCCFMRTVYNRKHLLGAFICLVGLALLITSDLLSKRNDDADSDAQDRVLGDILVLIGCIFYAISNIGQEYLVKSFDRFEFMGMLGLCGSIISAIQIVILERDALMEVPFNDPIVCAYLIGFNICLFMLYYFTPLLLLHSSALFMNLCE